jgi:4-amino-4-deoxy-L-arabinose transferase-like glycosyltransferase
MSAIISTSAFIRTTLLPSPGARDSWASVESRYIEIARFMFLRAEWIVPTIKPFDTLTLISITTVHMRRRKR